MERITLPSLLIPLLIVSCAAGPEPRSHQANEVPARISSPNSKAYYYFLRGTLAELSNNYSQAVHEYQAGLQEDPESTYLRVRLGKLYFSAGKMSSALETIGSVQEDQIVDAATLNQIAKIYAGAGRSDKALAVYNRAIELDPEFPDNYFSKGVLLLSLKQFEKARVVFEEGLTFVPNSHVGYYYLGRTLRELGNREASIASFEKAIDLAPPFDPAYQALAVYYEEQHDLAGAVKVYEQYLSKVNPHKKKFRQEVVRLLLAQKLYQRALEELDHIVADAPDDLNAQVRIALIQGEIGQYQKAIEQLAKILEKRPNELRVRDYLGLMYEELKDYDSARQVYEANIERDPTFYDSRIHLGFLDYRLKRFDQAVPHLKEAVKLNPGNPEPHLLLGLAYLQSQQPVLATAAFEYGIELHPENADLRFNLGAAYDKLNRFADVEREMEKVLSLNPDHADALNYLGYSYADRGIHIEKAVALTQRAVALKPQNGYYVDSFGWALFKMGRIEEALHEVQRASSLVKDDPVIYEHLGEIYLAQRNREKAKAAWLQSLKLDPSNKDLKVRYESEGFGVFVGPSENKHSIPQVSQIAPGNGVVP